MSNEKVSSHITENYCLFPKVIWINNWRIRVGFKGTFIFTKYLFFGAVKLTKNADQDKYYYSGYGYSYSGSLFSVPNFN